MKKMSFLLPLSLMLTPVVFGAGQSEAQVCTGDWVLNAGHTVPLYPDLNAAYLTYNFVHEAGRAIRISGPFAQARFQSFVVYEDEGGQLVNDLIDVEVAPKPGNENPYLPGVDRSTTDRDYEIWLAPEGSIASETDNAIVIPNAKTVVKLVMRVYLPDLGTDAVGLGTPVIESFDSVTMEPMDCPAGHSENGAGSGGLVLPPLLEKDVHFYRILGSDFYPSYDSSYLIAPIDPAQGDVVSLTFRAATTLDTVEGDGSFSGDEDLRYWSLCISRRASTTTPACAADSEIRVDRAGVAKVVFAPPTVKNKRAAQRIGATLIPWTAMNGEPLLLFRNMVPHPGFEYAADFVEPYEAERPPEVQWAELFIGAYAPVGVMCTSAEFQAGACF